jgi:hypothetical protein
MTTSPTIIKGIWNYAEIKAAQFGSFVFINSNGSKWEDEAPDDVHALIDALGKFPLDPTFEKYGNFISTNPCSGVRNPEFRKTEGAEEWIDGPRIFDVDGVVHFHGNFSGLSNVFSIYTNDAGTIQALTDAIRANQQRADYLEDKIARAA